MAFFDIIIRKKEVIYMSLTAGIVGLPNVGRVLYLMLLLRRVF